jgi:hypothetical protein
MPVTIPESERLLPSPERLEILDYLMGVYLSELDVIGDRVKRETTSTPADVADYLAAEAARVELPADEYDRGDLLELLRFTADALHDANTIREQANELQHLVLGALHESSNPSGPDDPAWIAYKEMIRAWHAERADHQGPSGSAADSR